MDGKEEPDEIEESDEPEQEEPEYKKEEDPELDYEDYLTEPDNSPVTPEQAEKEFNEVVNRQPAS